MNGVRISRRKPTDEQVVDFIVEQKRLELTYPNAGGTGGKAPPGYIVDRVSVCLGTGGRVFEAARTALENWEHFKLGWIEASPVFDPQTIVVDYPLIRTFENWGFPWAREGQMVAIVVRAMGLWWLNAARIVRVQNFGAGRLVQTGFAYGTLPGHAESGEELFNVGWDAMTDEVWYEIEAFSRPRHWLARLGAPVVRRMQRRFQRDSLAAMARAVDKRMAKQAAAV